MYRRTRRGRKTRYRPSRFDNRGNSKKEGRLAPSIRSKLEAHFREKRFVESLLPVTEWKVELASFDIHKITNPDVSGTDTRKGTLKGSTMSKLTFWIGTATHASTAGENQRITGCIAIISFSDQTREQMHRKT